MSTRHKNPRPLNHSGRNPKARLAHRQSAITTATTDRVVYEAVSAVQNIIRVSIETATYARQPERVIVF